MNLSTKNRQTIKTSFLILIFAVFMLPTEIHAEETKPKIDYSKKSNILNPDTLRGDQKLIFWHFVKLTYKEANELEPFKIKAGFAKLGITTEQRARFVKSYSFFASSMTNHKKSCEQWASFKKLAP